MKQRYYALLLAVAVAVSGCAVSEPEPEDISPEQIPVPAPVSELRLAYSASDSLNPYKMKTELNRQLIPLLYDSLTRVDPSYRPENRLAESVTYNGNICTVKLRRNILFSDGSLLQGADVVYSFRTAVASGQSIAMRLQNVKKGTSYLPFLNRTQILLRCFLFQSSRKGMRMPTSRPESAGTMFPGLGEIPVLCFRRTRFIMVRKARLKQSGWFPPPIRPHWLSR